MKVYKIKHIPTGLFFKPSVYRNKSNLSKNGKIYTSKPSLKWLDCGYHHPIPKKDWKNDDYEYRKFIEKDWEIIELNLNE